MDNFENKQSTLHQRINVVEALNDRLDKFAGDKLSDTAATSSAENMRLNDIIQNFGAEEAEDVEQSDAIKGKIELYRDQLSHPKADMPVSIEKLTGKVVELEADVADRGDDLGWSAEDE